MNRIAFVDGLLPINILEEANIVLELSPNTTMLCEEIELIIILGVDIYPAEPNPLTVDENSFPKELIYPTVPNPCTVDIRFNELTYEDEPRPITVDLKDNELI